MPAPPTFHYGGIPRAAGSFQLPQQLMSFWWKGTVHTSCPRASSVDEASRTTELLSPSVADPKHPVFSVKCNMLSFQKQCVDNSKWFPFVQRLNHYGSYPKGRAA